MIEYTKHFSENDMNKITSYLENERRVFVSTVGKIEYAAWWILRVCMIGAMVYWSKHEPGDFAITIMGFNLLATFAVPLARIIFFKKLFLGKIPFRVQSYINIFVFLGSFIGHGFKMNNVENYDKILHIISGAVTVFIGYEMLGSLKNAERTPHSVFLFGSAGFSFTDFAFSISDSESTLSKSAISASFVAGDASAFNTSYSAVIASDVFISLSIAAVKPSRSLS